MENSPLIPASVFCSSHNIEITFIHSLQENGLITVRHESEDYFIEQEQLSNLEKFIHLHYDLEINMAGIEVIQNMLQREEEKYREMVQLRNRLAFFEDV